jgi:hypothetical protein
LSLGHLSTSSDGGVSVSLLDPFSNKRGFGLGGKKSKKEASQLLLVNLLANANASTSGRGGPSGLILDRATFAG